MSSKSHIIDEATLNFKVYEVGNAMDIPKALEEWFLTIAVNELEDVCDNLCKSDEYVIIDKLEIDLQRVKVNLNDENLTTIVREKLRRELSQLLKNTSNSNKDNPVEIYDEDTHLINSFIHFMSNGILPWNTKYLNISALDEAILKNVKVCPKPLIDYVMASLPNKDFQLRLINNFSNRFIRMLTDQAIKKYSRDNFELKHLSEEASASQKQLYLENLVSLMDMSNSIKDLLQLSNEDDNSLEVAITTIENKTNCELEFGQRIYSDAVGILLLHPFLPTLFKALSFSDGNNFLGEKERHKGILLLYYLVYGHLEYDESSLSLFKLICGMRLDVVFNCEEQLSSQEKQETELVLKSAIKHWKVLKNTGIESFRNTFLKREGRITIKDEILEVDVNQKPVDILINKLPWSLSYIHLPWLTKKIRVNWA